MIEPLKSFDGLCCTINTTEDCNLRCKYCYETNKCAKYIDEETCKKFIDIVLEDPDLVGAKKTSIDRDLSWIYNGRIFDFIGGDALINPTLLDHLFTYINTKWNMLENKPINGWRASISTNGTLFKRKAVRDFCEKWKEVLSIEVSLDGCPEIHDLNRVYPDGRGSMADIRKWWPWFLKTFPGEHSTKATCSKESIPYMLKSLKFLHEEMGLNHINQNFIFENMHLTEKDLDDLDKQMSLCIEYVLNHRNEIYWSMIDRHRFGIVSKALDGDKDDRPFETKEEKLRPGSDFNTHGWCGSGMMPTLAINGDIYSCHRWLPPSQNGKKVMCIGNINDIEHLDKSVFETVRCGALRCNCTKDPKCLDCELEQYCSYCIAGCYAEYNDFVRQTHICEIHKMEYKWAKEYWRRYDELECSNK